jgi:hypothetical protein
MENSMMNLSGNGSTPGLQTYRTLMPSGMGALDESKLMISQSMAGRRTSRAIAAKFNTTIKDESEIVSSKDR